MVYLYSRACLAAPYTESRPSICRNRSTWAKATRHLWTKEEGELYVEQRKRLSAKLDPSVNLPSWCKADAEGGSAAGTEEGTEGGTEGETDEDH